MTPEHLEFLTIEVPEDDHLSPSDRISRHYDAVCNGMVGDLNPTHNGKIYLDCVYDALIAYGINIIDMAVDLSIRHRQANADFLIRNPGIDTHDFALLVGTSYRERWRKSDRDAMLMEDHYSRDGRKLEVRMLFDRERETNTLKQIRRKAAAIQELMGARTVRVVSSRDPEAMDKLWIELGAAGL